MKSWYYAVWIFVAIAVLLLVNKPSLREYFPDNQIPAGQFYGGTCPADITTQVGDFCKFNDPTAQEQRPVRGLDSLAKCPEGFSRDRLGSKCTNAAGTATAPFLPLNCPSGQIANQDVGACLSPCPAGKTTYSVKTSRGMNAPLCLAAPPAPATTLAAAAPATTPAAAAPATTPAAAAPATTPAAAATESKNDYFMYGLIGVISVVVIGAIMFMASSRPAGGKRRTR